MKEWKTYRLGDIITISSGFPYKGEFIGNGNNYLLGMGCVSFKETFLNSGLRQYSGDAPERYIAYPGDIVLATRQQSDNLPILGMPAIIPQDYNDRKMIVGANLYKVQNKSEFSNGYIYWLMKSPAYVHHIKSCQTGTTVRMITKANIEDFTFKAPHKSERERIASFLWSIEEKIAINRQINDNLEQQAQALYKSWFVDFEPFKNGKFVDSEQGLIPEGWRIGEFSEICDIVGGGTPSKSRTDFYCKNGIAWLTPKDLSESKAKFTAKGAEDITLEGYNSSSAKLMPRGAVLFSSRAPIGYITIAKNEISTNQGFKSAVPRIAGTGYLYYYLKSNISTIESKASGSTFKEASGALMKSLKVIVPPTQILNDFEKEIDALFRKQELLDDEIINLAIMRDTLLPKLMSGELTINEIDC